MTNGKDKKIRQIVGEFQCPLKNFIRKDGRKNILV